MGTCPHSHAPKVFNAQSFTLKNGLQVVVVPNHRAPVVTHMLWYKVGAADEPQGDGVSGEAHFLEHLMFKGSSAIKPGDFSKIVRRLGGEDNAFTSWDYTAYFQSISKNYLPTMMAMEADRMINIAPPKQQIEPEHQVIMEERRQTIDNDPKSLFWERLRTTLYNQTPYGIPIIGFKDEMPKISWDLARNYYQRWYAPNNAILVVSGDVTLNDMKKLAQKYYGALPSKSIPEHVRPDAQLHTTPQILTFRDPSVQQPLWVKVRLVPSEVQDYKTALAFSVLCEVLSGNSSTKLYQEFVVRRKKAIDVTLSYDGDARGQGSLWVYATPADGVNLKILEKEINEYFDELIAHGLTDLEVADAKTRLIDGSLYARDSVAGPAMVIGQGLASGLSLDQIEHWPRDISNINSRDVNLVLKNYLSSKDDAQKLKWVVGYMEPASK